MIKMYSRFPGTVTVTGPVTVTVTVTVMVTVTVTVTECFFWQQNIRSDGHRVSLKF